MNLERGVILSLDTWSLAIMFFKHLNNVVNKVDIVYLDFAKVYDSVIYQNAVNRYSRLADSANFFSFCLNLT